jgi:hypothetical protein
MHHCNDGEMGNHIFMEESMRVILLVASFFLLSVNCYAADDAADVANRAMFEKECADMIAPGGPCADVKAGGGGRRGCVAKPENLEKATPACKAVIEAWKSMQKK